MKRRKILAVAAVLTCVMSVSACGDIPPAKEGSGHNDNAAGVPDPPAAAPTPSNSVTLRFWVFSNIKTVVTYNAGHGNKFIDSLESTGSKGVSWDVGSYPGASVYLSSTPWERGGKGTITIKVENVNTGKLVCGPDSNFTNTKAGASCIGKVKSK